MALDVDTEKKVKTLVRELGDLVEIFKIGPRLFTRYGPRIIEFIQEEGGKVFYDAKFYDIPSVVEKAAQVVGEIGVDMFTLHTLGGSEMMKRASLAARGENPKIKAIGVTILTSLSSSTMKNELGIEKELSKEVLHLSGLAKGAGLDGVVASPEEVDVLRRRLGKDVLLVVPGIRPKGMRKDDQQRVMSPGEAIIRGADLLVVGRPVLEAKDPGGALEEILEEMEKALLEISDKEVRKIEEDHR